MIHTGIVCVEPNTPTNGSVTLSSPQLDVGTTATYSCDPGYVLIGEIIMSCEDVNSGSTLGAWSEEVPICKEINF